MTNEPTTHSRDEWLVYTVDQDGNLDWNADYNANIASYEEKFASDINGDGVIGANYAALETVSTDTDGIKLKRDGDSGTLYIWDDKSNDDASDDVITAITDSWGGNPHLEHSDSWDGGSHTSEAYAITQNADDTYTLVIRHTEKFDDTFFMPNPGNMGGGMPGDMGGMMPGGDMGGMTWNDAGIWDMVIWRK